MVGLGKHLERPLPLAMLAVSGYSLVAVGFGLLFFEGFREQVLYSGYTLRGYRSVLFVIGSGGLLVGFGATAMLLAS